LINFAKKIAAMQRNVTGIIIILLLLCPKVHAEGELKFSVFVNPMVQWLQSDVKEVSSQSARIGIDAGLTIDNYFEKRYAFTSGISIGTVGGKLRYDNGETFKVQSTDQLVPPGSDVTYKLQYITVPVGLKFKTNPIGYFSYFAHMGLTFQCNVKASANSSDGTLSDSDIGNNIHLFNLGYHFGLGTEYELGASTSLVFGLTYTNGFTDITTHKNDKITSSSIAIRLGVLF
jgi:hypothetical protein